MTQQNPTTQHFDRTIAELDAYLMEQSVPVVITAEELALA